MADRQSSFIGIKITADEVANFQTIANRAVGSPSEAIMQDFMVRLVTADDLYLILKDMGHKRGMELLEEYGELLKGVEGGGNEVIFSIINETIHLNIDLL